MTLESKVYELFGRSVESKQQWAAVVEAQECPFLERTCVKTRKSESSVAIGTCTVRYGHDHAPIMICPHRLKAGELIFRDCLPLLTEHRPGNSVTITPEVTIPGGSVDYFLVSHRGNRIDDFVGIELQTLDTTGSVWPERQRLIKAMGIATSDLEWQSDKSFGMNWKMTAKTILMQLHHKVHTLEHVDKKLVLVIQDVLMESIQRSFKTAHLSSPGVVADSLHIYSYQLHGHKLKLAKTYSTDGAGVAQLLGLEAEATIELSAIEQTLLNRMDSPNATALADHSN